MEIQVFVNPRKCMATQNCRAVAPDIFELGPAGYSRVKRTNLTAADLAQLRDAEEGCPTQAITVEIAEDPGEN